MLFSEKTLKYLRQAGWTEDRRLDLTAEIAARQAKNLPVFPVVFEFMARFANLELRFPDTHHPRYNDKIFFNTLSLSQELKEDYAAWCSEAVGKPLCRVGNAHGYQVDLLMDADGRVYGRRDDYLWCIANSGAEAIEAIVNGHKTLELYGDAWEDISGSDS